MNNIEELKNKIKELEKIIEKQKKEIHLLTETSLTDVLTGMPNRRAHDFRLKEIKREIERLKFEKKNTNGYFYYIMIDLDNFKLINDTYGHDIGDEALKQIAKTIQGHIRPTDFTFRLGGDEFSIILKNIEKEYLKNFLNRLIKKNNNLYYKDIKIGMSLGVAKFNGNIKETLKKADEAMYKSKKLGKNTFTCADEI